MGCSPGPVNSLAVALHPLLIHHFTPDLVLLSPARIKTQDTSAHPMATRIILGSSSVYLPNFYMKR